MNSGCCRSCGNRLSILDFHSRSASTTNAREGTRWSSVLTAWLSFTQLETTARLKRNPTTGKWILELSTTKKLPKAVQEAAAKARIAAEPSVFGTVTGEIRKTKNKPAEMPKIVQMAVRL